MTLPELERDAEKPTVDEELEAARKAAEEAGYELRRISDWACGAAKPNTEMIADETVVGEVDTAKGVSGEAEFREAGHRGG